MPSVALGRRACGSAFIQRLLERQSLKSAAEGFANALNVARSEALVQQRFVYVQINGQGTDRWCYAISNVPKCDCFSKACEAQQRTDSSSLTGVELGGSIRQNFRFNWKNGSAAVANGTTTFVGKRTGQRLCVVLSNLGRVRIATSSKKPVPGYVADASCQ